MSRLVPLSCSSDYLAFLGPCPSQYNSTGNYYYSTLSENEENSHLLVSPVLVASAVVGVVLILSCVTIIVGSIRRERQARLQWYRNQRLRYNRRHRYHNRDENNFMSDSHMHSRSSRRMLPMCGSSEEWPRPLQLWGDMDATVLQGMYPDAPPSYEECMGPGATQVYIPTDDPPPYSLTDSFPLESTLNSVALGPGIPNTGIMEPGILNPSALGAGILNPGALEAGIFNPGALEAGILNPGAMEAGIFNPGTLGTGILNPGAMEAGIFNPGALDSGILNPGALEAGIFNPGALGAGILNPGALEAGIFNPGALDSGILNPGALEPGVLNLDTLEPGTLNPGALEAGILNPGALEPGVLNLDTLEPGILNPGALEAGILNLGALEPGFLNLGALESGILNLGALEAGILNPGTLEPGIANPDALEPGVLGAGTLESGGGAGALGAELVQSFPMEALPPYEILSVPSPRSSLLPLPGPGPMAPPDSPPFSWAPAQRGDYE